MLLASDVPKLSRPVSSSDHVRRELQPLEPALRDCKVGSWEWDVTSGAVWFDKQWAVMLGEPEADLLIPMDQWIARLHPDDFPVARLACQRHLSGETPSYESIIRVRHRDGSWRWMRDRGRVVERDAHGNALRMTGAHADVTDQFERQA